MLASARLIAFIPTRDADRARSFYETTLGLTILHDDGFALVTEVSGTTIRIVRVGDFTPLPFTLLGWDVPDISAAVADLSARGIQFLRFPGMEQDASGIWTAPGTAARIAWFSDPDGNILSVSRQ
jgi:catechol 2,3-dioxygenase-like lactoylglutathione lyase family enzyme